MFDPTQRCLWVIGFVDYQDAIHHQILQPDDTRMHGDFWPNAYHKRWRFNVPQWELANSPMNDSADLNAEDIDRVMQLMRKLFDPPFWVLSGELWEKYGRPHKGREYQNYQKALRRLERKHGIKINTTT